MKIKKIDKQTEKQLLTGMIMSEKVLREIEGLYDPMLLEVPYVRTVGSWCRDYYKKYNTAPGEKIQDIFAHALRNGEVDEDQGELIEDFLTQLSEDFEQNPELNEDYLLDKTERHFKERSLKILSEDVSALVSNSEIEEAEALIGSYRLVERPKGSGVNPFEDEDVVREAFEEVEKPLFTFPGAFGQAYNDQFIRDSFIGIQGPEKRGKTWWCIEFAIRALRSRCNVAFFSVGDMSERQMTRRLMIRLTGRSHLKKYCGTVLVPVPDCYWNQIDDCDYKERTCNFGVIDLDEDGEKLTYEEGKDEGYVPCTECRKEANGSDRRYRGAVWHKEEEVEPLTWREAADAGDKLMKRLGRKQFKLATYPNDTMNIHGILTQLEKWEAYEGFVPDVVIIDYADILAPEPKSAIEERHKQNTTWKALRKLSQVKHCCVVTPTQADADAHDRKLQTMKNYSEDKRKYGHVTCMFTLNQSPEEKRDGVMRIGQLVVRDDEFDILSTISILSCLRKGRPFLDSFYTFS